MTGSTWQNIPHDLFDFQDFYSEIAQSLPDNCRVAEIGNADGASAIYLAEKLQSLGKKFSMRMIDNLDYGKLYQLNVLYGNVYKSGLHESIEIVPMDSLNASLKYPDGYYDFVYIDSGHGHELTKAEIRLWIRKIKDGGTLAGHDTHLEEVSAALKEVVENGLELRETAKNWGVWVLNKTPELIII